jgi:hypothetical protein
MEDKEKKEDKKPKKKRTEKMSYEYYILFGVLHKIIEDIEKKSKQNH